MSFTSPIPVARLIAIVAAALCAFAGASCGNREAADEKSVEAAARHALSLPRIESHAQFIGAPRSFSGHYLGDSLVLCGSTVHFWLPPDSHQALAPFVSRLLGPSALAEDALRVPLFVRVLAVPSSQDPAYPNPSDGRGIRIAQVLEVRAFNEHDCPE